MDRLWHAYPEKPWKIKKLNIWLDIIRDKHDLHVNSWEPLTWKTIYIYYKLIHWSKGVYNELFFLLREPYCQLKNPLRWKLINLRCCKEPFCTHTPGSRVIHASVINRCSCEFAVALCLKEHLYWADELTEHLTMSAACGLSIEEGWTSYMTFRCDLKQDI